MTQRASRLAALVLLPLLAGALLLMHGLDVTVVDASGHEGHTSVHSHADADAHDTAPVDEDHCGGCLAHLMVACVAVITAVLTWQVGRRCSGHLRPTPGVAGKTLIRMLAEHVRARDPAWVRLSVMNC